ncbi:MAG: hypothetical protein LBS53_07240, partial [Synergistaceae bacterium]|nr:hypothetical protein [Synergistaceae bacterium]
MPAPEAAPAAAPVTEEKKLEEAGKEDEKSPPAARAAQTDGEPGSLGAVSGEIESGTGSTVGSSPDAPEARDPSNKGRGETGKPDAIVTPETKMSNAVADALERGEPMGGNKAFARFGEDAYGTTRGESGRLAKDEYDVMELGINKYIAKKGYNPSAATAEEAKRDIAEIESGILKNLPRTERNRSAEQVQLQQFSTPPNIAYAANWALQSGEGDIVLEPSAGVGGLATYAKNSGAKVIANEISDRRRALLEQLKFDAVTKHDASFIDSLLAGDESVSDMKPTRVVMNPPFSSGLIEGKAHTNNVGATHVRRALYALSDGGRAVIILGKGMGLGTDRGRAFWNDIGKNYNVRAVVGINGSNYEKYGTDFDVEMAVVDKTGPTSGTPVKGRVNDLSDLIDLLAPVRDMAPAESPQVPQVSEERPQTVSAEENTRRGDEAMDRVIRDHADAMDAMYRNDVGGISFIWGTKDTVIVDGKKRKPHGIAHAIDEHGEEAVRKMPYVLANGEISARYAEGTKHERVDITHGGYLAHLALYQYEDRKTWLITGYEENSENPSGASGEGFDSSRATLDGPTHARPAEGAEGKSPSPAPSEAIPRGAKEETKRDAKTIPQKDADSKPAPQRRDEENMTVGQKDAAERVAEQATPGAQDRGTVRLDPSGLQTESGRSFSSAERSELVLRKDGSPVLGRITNDVAKNAGIAPGDIYVNAGAVQHAENEHGEQIKKAGYDNAQSMIADVLNDYSEIREGADNSVLLIKRAPGTKSPLMAVELIQEDGNYHTKTAWLARNDYIDKRKLLSARSATLVTGPDSDLASLSAAPDSQGEPRRWSARQESSSDADNIPQAGRNGNVQAKVPGQAPRMSRGDAVIAAQKLVSSKGQDGIDARELYNGAKRAAAAAGASEKDAQKAGFEAVVDKVQNAGGAGQAMHFQPGAEETAVSPEENIRRGNKAMEQVIRDHTDVRDAMYREELGGVSFLWGSVGTPGENGKTKGGHGVSHIIDKHGEETVRKMPEVIAKGEITKRYAENKPQQERVDIVHDGLLAHLALYKDGNRQTWLLTGYEIQKKSSDEIGPFYDGINPTLSEPTHSRPEEGAEEINKNIPRQKENRNFDYTDEKQVQESAGRIKDDVKRQLVDTGESEEHAGAAGDIVAS